MAKPLLEDVFKTSGVPTHTFAAPSEFPRLRVALRTAGRGVVVEGPSGIGKTTAVTRALEEIGMTGSAEILSARVPGNVEYIAELPHTSGFGVVIVDDLHVLPLDVNNALADQLKVLADAEDATSKLVIVGINRAGDALVRHAPDLAARLDVLRFEVEPPEKLEQVVRLGEEALNLTLSAAGQIVTAAQGSFYLVQILSRELCLAEGVTKRQDERVRVTAPYSNVKHRVMDQQESRFGPVVRKFARGPRFRPSGRANYLLLLKWLAESDRWDIVLREEIARHPEHRRSVGQVVDKGWLAGHAAADDIAEVLHYDPDGNVLSVEDPSWFSTRATWTGRASRAPWGLRTSSSSTCTTLRCPSPVKTGRWPMRSMSCSTPTITWSSTTAASRPGSWGRTSRRSSRRFMPPTVASSSPCSDAGTARSAGRSSRASSSRAIRRRACHPDLGQGRPAVTVRRDPQYRIPDVRLGPRPSRRGGTAGEGHQGEAHPGVARDDQFPADSAGHRQRDRGRRPAAVCTSTGRRLTGPAWPWRTGVRKRASPARRGGSPRPARQGRQARLLPHRSHILG
jgi:YD repeat-containing protein